MANVIANGGLRRMPRNLQRLWEIAGEVVSIASESNVLSGKPETSKRFAVYMAVCFVVGKKSMKMMSQATTSRLKRVVRSARDYNKLMDA